MQQEDLIKKVRTFSLAVGAVYIIMGIMMVAFQDQFKSFLGILIGIVACAFGAYRLFVYFKQSREQTLIATDLFIGIVVLLLGIICLVKHAVVLDFVELIFCLLLFAGALVKIQNAIDLHHLGYTNWWLVAVLGLVSIVFSVLMILQPKFVVNIYMTIAGIFLIYDGASNIFAAVMCNSVMGRIRNGQGPNRVVDTTASETTADTSVPGGTSHQAPAFDAADPAVSSVDPIADPIAEPNFDPETGDPLN